MKNKKAAGWTLAANSATEHGGCNNYRLGDTAMILRTLMAILLLMAGNAFTGTGSATIYLDDFNGDFGEFRAGFKFIDLVDKSRIYDYSGQNPADAVSEKGGRPVRIYIWYPAVQGKNGEGMSFGRYLEIADGDFNVDRRPVIIPDKLPLERALSDEQLKTMARLATKAYEDARPADGVFPLILLGQGLYFENPITHFALCEFFASHGFVVATCPLAGTNSPMVMLTVRDLESIVRDLEFVLEYCRNQPYVDADSVGIIGFDIGGMAAQILQVRNAGIEAVMTMDAGIIFTHFSGLPANHPSFEIQKITAPWLHMTQTRFMEPYRQYLDQSVWGQVSCDRYLMLFPDVEHVNFTSYGLLNVPSPLAAYWGDSTIPNVQVSRAIGRSGLAFMKAYLKNDQKALNQLAEEAANHTPGRVFTMEIKQATAPGLTLDQFLNQIISGDSEKAVEQARKFKKDNPAWPFYPENAVNDIGYRFLYALGETEIALKIFKLNVDMNPQSGNVYDSYAEALLAMNRIPEAIENYAKSLELDPNNENARKMLEELKNRG